VKFTLTIDMDNAAFDEDERAEAARILAVACDQLTARLDDERGCYDVNGNNVGHWEITS